MSLCRRLGILLVRYNAVNDYADYGLFVLIGLTSAIIYDGNDADDSSEEKNE